MQVIYRQRNVIEEMDYALLGDRPIDHFRMSEHEYEQYLKLAMLDKTADDKLYREYKGIQIVIT